LRSLPPSSYIALPKLQLPASYICVLRDVDSGCYRIDKTQAPPGFIEDVLAERDGDYGIELLAIVRTADLDAFESLLHERHDASLGVQWMSLDDYQLAELRNSALQINAFHSSYLTAQQHHHALASAGAAATSDAVKRAGGETRESGQATLQGLLSNRVGAAKQPRRRTRRPIRTRSELWNQEMPPEQASLRQRIDDKINHLFVNDPVLLLAILILIVFAVFFAFVALIVTNPTWRYPTVIR